MRGGGFLAWAPRDRDERLVPGSSGAHPRTAPGAPRAAQSSSEDDTTNLWTVSLTRPGGSPVTVGIVGDAGKACELGQRVAELLGPPFSDRGVSRRDSTA